VAEVSDSAWLVWLGVALVCGIVEVTTLDLVFAMVAGGALAAAVPAALGVPFGAQTLVFALTSAALLLLVRPSLKRYALRSSPQTPTNVRALAGRRAEVLTEVTGDSGTVKLAGETWTARVARPGERLEVGSPVEVVAIDGATALVQAVQHGPEPGALSDEPDGRHP
jgi:membrane protein implicated in regulation of membrane protease activity